MSCFPHFKIRNIFGRRSFHNSLTLEGTRSQNSTSFTLLEWFRWTIKRSGFPLHLLSQNEQTNCIWSNRFISGFSTWNHPSHFCAAMWTLLMQTQNGNCLYPLPPRRRLSSLSSIYGPQWIKNSLLEETMTSHKSFGGALKLIHHNKRKTSKLSNKS